MSHSAAGTLPFHFFSTVDDAGCCTHSISMLWTAACDMMPPKVGDIYSEVSHIFQLRLVPYCVRCGCETVQCSCSQPGLQSASAGRDVHVLGNTGRVYSEHTCRNNKKAADSWTLSLLVKRLDYELDAVEFIFSPGEWRHCSSSDWLTVVYTCTVCDHAENALVTQIQWSHSKSAQSVSAWQLRTSVTIYSCPSTLSWRPTGGNSAGWGMLSVGSVMEQHNSLCR